MAEALIVIDYTYDFVADDGCLTCGKPGQSIERVLVELVKEFLEQGKFVVIANDVHEANDQYHPEAKLFPSHNLKGTKGRELYGCLKQVVDEFEGNINLHWIDKTRYSAFAGTDLEIKLRERKIERVHLVGVCTDICVLHTAVDAYNRGFEITIHANAVQSFNAVGHEWALNHFKHTLGADVQGAF